MNTKQKVSLITPVVLMGMMYLVFQLLAGVFKENPNNIPFRIIWPSIWFALWHYVPGSISPSGNQLGLMIGSGLMGFYLSFLAKKTDTIWWTIIAHVLGGFIMIV